MCWVCNYYWAGRVTIDRIPDDVLVHISLFYRPSVAPLLAVALASSCLCERPFLRRQLSSPETYIRGPKSRLELTGERHMSQYPPTVALRFQYPKFIGPIPPT